MCQLSRIPTSPRRKRMEGVRGSRGLTRSPSIIPMSISSFDCSFRTFLAQPESQSLSTNVRADAPLRKSPTVLVADDNDDTRQMLHMLLTGKGYRVLEAADGEEAVRLTSNEEPGLVLLDLQLPKMNGLNVIRQLRNEMHLTTIPLVIITGYDKHFDTAVAAGCDDYMVKPIDFDRLARILDYYVPLKVESPLS